MTEIHPDSVCAIVITYNPDCDELVENLNAIVPQVGMTIVVDNSTDAVVSNQIASISSGKLETIKLGDNRGIATAQNIGIGQACREGFKAVLLLDQDTYSPDGLVIALCSAHNHILSKNHKVACVGPEFYNRDSVVPKAKIDAKGIDFSRINPMAETLSSGSLIPLEAYLSVGGMDETLFIDLVDWEWCWRARAMGFETFIFSDVKIAHRLGEGRISILGVEVGLPIPVRHYYQFRNTLRLMGRDYAPLAFKIKYSALLPLKFLFYSLIVPPRLVRLKYMLKGINHWFSRKNGPHRN